MEERVTNEQVKEISEAVGAKEGTVNNTGDIEGRKCFWCGGVLDVDSEDNYAFCSKCLQETAEGVTLIEVTTEPKVEGMPVLLQREKDGANVYPTGNRVCVTVEYAKGIMYKVPMKIEAGMRLCIDSDIFRAVVRTLMKQEGAVK